VKAGSFLCAYVHSLPSETRVSSITPGGAAPAGARTEALRSATTVSADLCGIADRTGRVQMGLEADLIVLERNPFDNIGAVQDVFMVINNGRIAVTRGDWSATN
jgi:predicted amidohydrolase YtcJ